MNKISQTQLKEAIQNFSYSIPPDHITITPHGNGHINDTFLLTFDSPYPEKSQIILQRINTDIFTCPEELMENIAGVTAWLKKKIIEEGGDPCRETLTLIAANNGKSFYKDSAGFYWRAFLFIADTICLEQIQKPEDFYESAVSFGRFQKMLADYPVATLHETIKGFHDTRSRFRTFRSAVALDIAGRVKYAEDEIRFVLERESIAGLLGDLHEKGQLPLRVTHNDTKLNNIMFDKQSHKGICIIDLDTVMPGLSVNDFGDAIRFGASTAAEDETDLEKVSCSMELFELYVKGFLEGCGGRLTQKEIELLPVGAKVMTYECGMRFLTDYLEGDHYFKISRESHNLDRCRTQFRLVQDMEEKWETMQRIVTNALPI